MQSLVLAETTKLRTIRTTPGLLLAAAIISALLSFGAASVAGEAGNVTTADPAFVFNLIGGASMATLVALVAGVLLSTGEFHHGTAVSTYLANPRRWRVVTAKALVAIAFGTLIALVALVVALAAGSVATGGDTSFGNAFRGDGPRLMSAVVLRGAFLAVAGVAIGGLVHNQVGALAVAVIWAQVVELVVIPLTLPAAESWMPDSLLASVAGAVRPDQLHAWAAFVLLVLYAAALTAAAAWSTQRMDLT